MTRWDWDPNREPEAVVEEPPPRSRVVLTGLDISFWDLVVVLVKVTLASIPAMLILAMLAGVVILVLMVIGIAMGY